MWGFLGAGRNFEENFDLGVDGIDNLDYHIINKQRKTNKEVNMAIIGFNQAREYNSRMTNTLQNHIRNQGHTIIEENEIGSTMTELIYDNGSDIRYAYIQETGGMSDAPGQQSIISDTRLSYREATIAILRHQGGHHA